MRNDKVFNNNDRELDELVKEVKILSWIWSLHRLKTLPCLYYEWCEDPGIVCGGRCPKECYGYGLLGFWVQQSFFFPFY